MAYDVELAGRVRDLLAGQPGVTERAMFGGLALMVDGHMALVVSGRGGLMARHDPDDLAAWVAVGVARARSLPPKEPQGD